MRPRRSSAVWATAWLVGVTALTGCQQQPPSAAPAEDGVQATIPQAARQSATADQVAPVSPQLSSVQQQVLQQVRAAGGEVEGPIGGATTLIDLASDRVSADDPLVQSLIAFPRLKRLRLAASSVGGDTVLTLLQELPELRELLLQDVPLTDQQLSAALQRLSSLERLTLRRLGGVTDQSITALQRCQQLEVLALIEMNGITGASLVELRQLSALRAVDLRNCGNLRLEDFRHLLQLPQLADLKLGGPAVTDEVLSVIVQHPRLYSLSIEDAEVSQDCLECLATNRAFASRLRTLSFALLRALGCHLGAVRSVSEARFAHAAQCFCHRFVPGRAGGGR